MYDSAWVLLQMERARLLMSDADVAVFKHGLFLLADMPQSDYFFYRAVAVLDDATRYPDVMAGLVRYLEAYDDETLRRVLPQIPAPVVLRARGWLEPMLKRANIVPDADVSG